MTETHHGRVPRLVAAPAAHHQPVTPPPNRSHHMQPQPATEAVAQAIRDLGYRVRVDAVNPPNALADSISVWRNINDRYPADTAWAPIEDDPDWNWGPSFEYRAPRDLTPAALAAMIVGTILNRLPLATP